ncbi:WD40 repeat domain-containing protein [Streptomyces canus]|uniref:WD40 repeat domain-containing protein n=1 Tax=Streptomyces canus TaxID=58343 RepID=UPI00039D3B89|nr:WD40 repeat domain-containing protein [Streptomyces canus]
MTADRPEDRELRGLGLASPGAYAVLVGTGHHVEGSLLPGLPGVDTTLDDLQSLLADACRMTAEHILRLPADASPPDVVTVLENTVEQADGPVLFYYVGHGLLGPKDDLHLATHGSRHAESISHAVPYRTVQDLLGRAVGGSAVILDCCFSGRAGAPRGRRTADPFASARPDGSFLLTSASHFAVSFAPLGARHTLFSGRLLGLLRDGDPGGPRVLTLDDLHDALVRSFADGPVTPRQWSEGTLGRLVVAANRAYPTAAEPLRTAPADVPCPYPGMKPFAAEDHMHFTGRDDVVADLVTRVCRARPTDPVVLVGPSGVGKSSLLRAGLLAELQLRHEAGTTPSAPWPVLLLPAPGAKPLQALARLWSEAVDRPFDDVLADLTEGCFPPPRDDRPPCGLLVVDQFEEIFARAADPGERRQFIRLLCGPAPESERALRLRRPRVVVGVRADHYGSCLAEAPLAQALARGQISLTPMSTESLRTAIEEPARRVGLTLETGLVQRLLHDLRERDTTSRGHAALSPETAPDTALPFLAHALRETWLARDGAVLTLAGYQSTGGIWQSVATATERLYTDLDEPERAALRPLLLRMVQITSGGEVVRRPLRTTDVGGTAQEPPGRTPGQRDSDGSDAVRAAGSGADVPPRRSAPDGRVLDRLVRARLVTVDRGSVQISHDALLHTWPRLNTWIRDAQHELPVHQQLTEDAALWLRHGRGAAYLYTGDRLVGVRPWLTSAPPPAIPLDTTTRAFLEASVSAGHRKRRRARRYLSVVLCVLLAASGTFAALWNSATEQRERAEDQQRRSVARSLVLHADALRDTQADDALRFGAAGQRLFPTAEGRTGLVSTLVERHRVTFLTDHTGPVESIAYRPDGRVLATASTDRTVILWNAPGTLEAGAPADRAHPHRIARLPRQKAPLTAVGFSPDGRTLAVGSQDRTVTLWDVADPARPRRVAELRGLTRGVEAVAFSPDRRSLLTGGAGTDAVLWDVTKPESPRRLSVLKGGSSGPVHGVAFSPDGRTAVVDGAGPAPTIWSLTDRSHPVDVGFVPIRGSAQTEVFSVAVAANGDTLAAATSDNGVGLWSIAQLVDTQDQQPLATLSEHAGPVRGVAFSRDGRRIATVGSDGTAQLWDVHEPFYPRLLTRFTDHRDAVTSVAFAPDGRTIATASDDGRAAVWELADSLAPRREASTSAPDIRVPAAAFTPDRDLLTLRQAYDENDLDGPMLPSELWDATRPTAPRRLSSLDTGDVNTAAFSRDGRLLATGSPTGTIRLWDITAPDDPRLLDTTTVKGAVLTLAFSGDGRALAVASDDFEGPYEEMELWDVGRRGALRRLARLPLSQVNAMTFSPVGPTLAVATEKQGTSLWDISSPSRPRRLVALGAREVPGVTVEFSPDGRRLALADASGQITLYGITGSTRTTAQPRPLGSVSGNIGKAAAVAFDSTGTMLAASTSGESGRTLLWDITDAARPLPLASVMGDLVTMGEVILFTPDRRRLITAGDATTETESSGAAEKVRPAQLVRWDIRPAVAVVDDPIRAACTVTGQGLTDAEWARYADGLPRERTCPGD